MNVVTKSFLTTIAAGLLEPFLSTSISWWSKVFVGKKWHQGEHTHKHGPHIYAVYIAETELTLRVSKLNTKQIWMRVALFTGCGTLCSQQHFKASPSH